MMHVVAVALSTATYAWFTSNTKVEASTISLTAATSTGAAFGIAWTNENYGTTLADVTTPVAGSFKPLVPATYSTETNSETTTAVRFATATIKQVGGAEKYNGDVLFWDTAEAAKEAAQQAENYSTAAKPYIWNNGTVNSFWIKNLSTNNGQEHLYVYADVEGAGSELVRIAIFDTGKLVGILGYKYTYTSAAEATWDEDTDYYKAVTDGYLLDETVDSSNFASKKATLYTRGETLSVTPTYYGTVTAGANVLTTQSNSSKVLDLGQFDALEAREITVYVWLDGKFLNDDTQGSAASIDLHFDVVSPSI